MGDSSIIRIRFVSASPSHSLIWARSRSTAAIHSWRSVRAAACSPRSFSDSDSRNSLSDATFDLLGMLVPTRCPSAAGGLLGRGVDREREDLAALVEGLELAVVDGDL